MTKHRNDAIIASMNQEDLDTILITVKMGQPYFVIYRSDHPNLRPDNIFVIQFYDTGKKPDNSWQGQKNFPNWNAPRDPIVAHIMDKDHKWQPASGWTIEQMAKFLETGEHKEETYDARAANGAMEEITLKVLYHGYTLDEVFKQLIADYAVTE